MYRLCANTRPKRPEIEQGFPLLSSGNSENLAKDLVNKSSWMFHKSLILRFYSFSIPVGLSKVSQTKTYHSELKNLMCCLCANTRPKRPKIFQALLAEVNSSTDL